MLQGKAADDWSSKCIDMVYKANEFQAKVVNCECCNLSSRNDSHHACLHLSVHCLPEVKLVVKVYGL